MKAIVISPKSQSELKFITSLLKRLGLASKILSDTEIEDAGLSILMSEVDKRKKVGKATIMKKLRS